VPYIQQCQRSLLDPSIVKLAKDIKHIAKKLATDDSNTQMHKIVPGLANYSITALMLTLIGEQEPSYATYNAVIGVLEAAKQEFYRTHVAPFENQKQFENGPVVALEVPETIN
jgi:hypothetical protein